MRVRLLRRSPLVCWGMAVALAASTVVAVSAWTWNTPAHAASTSEGVDLTVGQPDVDMSAAAKAGITFAIVKAGGSQLKSGPYRADNYIAQEDSARKAGVKIGHVWVEGDFQSPKAAADSFVATLHDYRTGDVLALDDEILDDSTHLWKDADAAAFLSEVQAKKGSVPLWFYIGADNLRTSGPWTKTIATGAKLWVASYGSNDGTYQGAPDLGGAYPAYAVHQYTSKGTVAGIDASSRVPVDRDRAASTAFDPVTVPNPTTTPKPTSSPSPTAKKLPKTTTESDGVPGTVFYERFQHWLAISDGYTGPIDGKPGVNTYKAFQRDMAAHWGYTGPIDGDPGVNTYKAWQRQATHYGYTGPIDGDPGPNTYRAIAKFLNEDRWD